MGFTGLSSGLALKKIDPNAAMCVPVESDFTHTWPDFEHGAEEVIVNIVKERVVLVYIPIPNVIRVLDLFRLESEWRVIDLSELGVERPLGRKSRSHPDHQGLD